MAIKTKEQLFGDGSGVISTLLAEHLLADGKVMEETTYGVTSLTQEQAGPDQLLQLKRAHWGIENGLHWVLDVAFNEDRMRQRDRNGIENLALLTSRDQLKFVITDRADSITKGMG